MRKFSDKQKASHCDCNYRKERQYRCGRCVQKCDKNLIEGYWLKKTRNAVDDSVVLYITRQKDDSLTMEYFPGTSNNIRELTPVDFISGNTTWDINPVPVVKVNERLYKLLEINAIPGNSEDLFVPSEFTFARIQDDDDNTLIVTENIPRGREEARYIRLNKRPNIQPYGAASTMTWNNPQDQVKYTIDYLLSETNDYATRQFQDDVALNQNQVLAEMDKTFTQKFELTSNVTKIWRTKPGSGSRTRLFVDRDPLATQNAKVVITGFTNAWSDANGEYILSTRQSLPFQRSPNSPYTLPDEFRNWVLIDLDTSAYPEYNSGEYGNATVKVIYEPITKDAGYRDTMASLWYLIRRTFGTTVHQGISAWGPGVSPETYDELTEYVKTQSYSAFLDIFMPLRTGRLTYAGVTWNPFMHSQAGGAITQVVFQRVVNDDQTQFPQLIVDSFPLPYLDPKSYNYDVVLNNYGNLETARNIFWKAVQVGPVNPDPTFITNKLVDLGYPNNGNRFEFSVGPAYRTSPDGQLVLDFADPGYSSFAPGLTGPWRLGGGFSRFNFQGTNWIQSQVLYGTMLDTQYTSGKKIAYVRVGQWGGFNPYDRFIEFYPDDEKTRLLSQHRGPLEYYATLIQHLNQYEPDAIILDQRGNPGGNAGIAGNIFGGKRNLGYQFKASTVSGDLPTASALAVSQKYGPDQTIEDIVPKVQFGPVSQEETVKNSYPFTQQEIIQDLVSNGVFNKNGGKVAILGSEYMASAAVANLSNLRGPGLNDPPGTSFKSIGDGVESLIVGQANATNPGGRENPNPLPTTEFNNQLIDGDGLPVPALTFDTEVGGQFRNINQTKAINNEIPELAPDVTTDQAVDTNWSNFGLANPPARLNPPYLSGVGKDGVIPDKNNNKTWRDRDLEEAILAVVAALQ